MACPTCYRQLIIPEAPANGGGKLILTAAEVQSRPVPVASAPGFNPPVAAAKKFPVAAVLLILLLASAAAAAFMFREKLFHRTPVTTATGEEGLDTNHPPAVSVPSLALAPSDADKNWTLDPTNARAADAPVSGRVHGFTFTLDRATLTGGTLQLRQGAKWPPDLGVTVYLFAERGEDLAGKTIAIGSSRNESPKVTLRWKDEQAQARTENVRGGYSMRLEFGALAGKSLSGKIYLATQDAEKSFVSGTFTAEIRKPTPKK